MKPPDPRFDGIHGTATAYKGGCRCAACRYYMAQANAKNRKRQTKKLIEKNGKPFHPDVTHGTNSGYQYGCRCTPCEKAHAWVVSRKNTKRRD